jgi:hypothetical protein
MEYGKETETWYRYEEAGIVNGDPNDDPHDVRPVTMLVNLRKFRVLRRTRECIFLDDGSFDVHRMKRKGKRVLVNAKKKWACPTPEEALESFIRRKLRQVELLEYQLEKARRALRMGIELQKEKGDPIMSEYMLSEEETIRLAEAGRIRKGTILWAWDDGLLPRLRCFSGYIPDEELPWLCEDLKWQHARLVTQKYLDEYAPEAKQLDLLPEEPPRGEPVWVRGFHGEVFGFYVGEGEVGYETKHKFKVDPTGSIYLPKDGAGWRRMNPKELEEIGWPPVQ